jgi:hypothetical protein
MVLQAETDSLKMAGAIKPLENLIGKDNNLNFQKTDDQASKQDWVIVTVPEAVLMRN